MSFKEIKAVKLTQSEGSNHVCEVMKKNHTKCTTHAAFHLVGHPKYNYVCAFHFNIFKSLAANLGYKYVEVAPPSLEEQVSPETRVS